MSRATRFFLAGNGFLLVGLLLTRLQENLVTASSFEIKGLAGARFIAVAVGAFTVIVGCVMMSVKSDSKRLMQIGAIVSEPGHVVGLFQAVDGCNIRMIQRGEHARFVITLSGNYTPANS